jgi:hypothetical protein
MSLLALTCASDGLFSIGLGREWYERHFADGVYRLAAYLRDLLSTDYGYKEGGRGDSKEAWMVD